MREWAWYQQSPSFLPHLSQWQSIPSRVLRWRLSGVTPGDSDSRKYRHLGRILAESTHAIVPRENGVLTQVRDSVLDIVDSDVLLRRQLFPDSIFHPEFRIMPRWAHWYFWVPWVSRQIRVLECYFWLVRLSEIRINDRSHGYSPFFRMSPWPISSPFRSHRRQRQHVEWYIFQSWDRWTSLWMLWRNFYGWESLFHVRYGYREFIVFLRGKMQTNSSEQTECEK